MLIPGTFSAASNAQVIETPIDMIITKAIGIREIAVSLAISVDSGPIFNSTNKSCLSQNPQQ